MVCAVKRRRRLVSARVPTQKQVYCKRGQEGHALCLNDARKAVRTVLLVAARLMLTSAVHNSDRQPQQQRRRSRRVAFKTQQKVLPDLLDELRFCILSLIPRHELGGAIA